MSVAIKTHEQQGHRGVAKVAKAVLSGAAKVSNLLERANSANIFNAILLIHELYSGLAL